MTDIEKRAESSVTFKKFEDGIDEKDVFLHNVLMQGRREGYIKGAKEQKAIDDDHFRSLTQKLIDKACKWLEMKQAHIVSESGVWLMWTAFIKDFRKALEEE